MSYYVRIFCKVRARPTLDALRQSFATAWPAGTIVQLGDASDGAAWCQLSVTYKAGKEPILVEWNDGSDDAGSSLLRDEIQEFIDEVGPAGRSKWKKVVIEHLTATQAIVAAQLPFDIDEDGYEANYEFLKFFATQCEGMAQADGEGFYAGDKLVVRL